MAIHTSLGTPTANSYVSTASANEYFQTRENSDNWDDIGDESTTSTIATATKENLLIQATREIDRTYRFHDTKYNQGIRGQDTYQNLEFPRFSNIDADTNLFIPDEIKYATYEQALWIRERTGKRTTEDGAVIEKQIIGDESFDYLKEWINRQTLPTGKYPWQGSKF
jgi:hypothetical protein